MSEYNQKNPEAVLGIVIYSLINIVWIGWAYSSAGFGIFRTAPLIGICLPIAGVITLISYQRINPSKKFSTSTNIISCVVIVAWFLGIWSIIAEASAAV